MIVAGLYNNGAPYQVNFQKRTENLISEIFFYPDYKLQMIGKVIDKQKRRKMELLL